MFVHIKQKIVLLALFLHTWEKIVISFVFAFSRCHLGTYKMFTKVDALADIHAPFFGPVFSYNLQFLNYFIENKALQAFYFILI